MKAIRLVFAVLGGGALIVACSSGNSGEPGDSTADASASSSSSGSVNTGSSSSSSSGTATGSSSSSGGVLNPDAAGVPIACGMGLTCEPPMECCMVRMRVDGGRAGQTMVENSCVSPGSCPDGGVVEECASELDCRNGEMCCRGAAGGATTCAAACMGGAQPVCETAAGCPAGDMCVIGRGATTGACARDRDAALPPPVVRDAGARDATAD